jgi:hypothetical protein
LKDTVVLLGFAAWCGGTAAWMDKISVIRMLCLSMRALARRLRERHAAALGC